MDKSNKTVEKGPSHQREYPFQPVLVLVGEVIGVDDDSLLSPRRICGRI